MTTTKKALIGISVSIFFLSAIGLLPEDRDKIKTKHFTFIFSRSIDSQKIINISKSLEDSYLRIARNLKTIPSKGIETNIYADRWNYITATKHFGASGNIEGPSKIHFIESSLEESKKIAVHEFTHTVVLNLLISREAQPLNSKTFDQKFSSFPTWLWEAISVYEAEQFIDPKNLEDLRNGKYPSIKELNTRSKGQKIYTYGYTLIEFILDKYKGAKLIELVQNYGDLKKTFGITDEQFSKDWYDFVRDKYINKSSR
jgi:hypothetical protein